MKEYNKYNKFYILGVNSNNYNYIKFFLYYKYHGLYYYLYLNNNEIHISKGYYNMNMEYSHWRNDYNEPFILKYYI